MRCYALLARLVLLCLGFLTLAQAFPGCKNRPVYSWTAKCKSIAGAPFTRRTLTCPPGTWLTWVQKGRLATNWGGRNVSYDAHLRFGCSDGTLLAGVPEALPATGTFTYNVMSNKKAGLSAFVYTAACGYPTSNSITFLSKGAGDCKQYLAPRLRGTAFFACPAGHAISSIQVTHGTQGIYGYTNIECVPVVPSSEPPSPPLPPSPPPPPSPPALPPMPELSWREACKAQAACLSARIRYLGNPDDQSATPKAAFEVCLEWDTRLPGCANTCGSCKGTTQPVVVTCRNTSGNLDQDRLPGSYTDITQHFKVSTNITASDVGRAPLMSEADAEVVPAYVGDTLDSIPAHHLTVSYSRGNTTQFMTGKGPLERVYGLCNPYPASPRQLSNTCSTVSPAATCTAGWYAWKVVVAFPLDFQPSTATKTASLSIWG